MLGIKRDKLTETNGKSWIGPAPWIETSLPGANAKTLLEHEDSLGLPSYTRDYPLVVQRGLGSVIEDVDGNRFLDFSAAHNGSTTGHCHPKVTAAIEAQAGTLIHICAGEFHYPPMTELRERLASLVSSGRREQVLLTSGAGEAVQAAIKLARHVTGKQAIVAFHHPYYGRSADSPRHPAAKLGQQGRFGSLIAVEGRLPYGDLGAIESRFLKQGPPEQCVAAVFVEALPGEGGYVIPEPAFLPKLRSLCDKHSILLVCDETMSGVGRTGKWFAFEHFDILPDIIVMGKGTACGMPLGAVITRLDKVDWPSGVRETVNGANPICCAAARATLDLVASSYMANAERLGNQLRTRLRQLGEKKRIVANVTGLGLMCSADIVNRKTGRADARLRKRLLKSCFERGLILLPCGESGIRFSPPLCINSAQLDVGLKVLEEGAATVA